jgi:hypothetical protein
MERKPAFRSSYAWIGIAAGMLAAGIAIGYLLFSFSYNGQVAVANQQQQALQYMQQNPNVVNQWMAQNPQLRQQMYSYMLQDRDFMYSMMGNQTFQNQYMGPWMMQNPTFAQQFANQRGTSSSSNQFNNFGGGMMGGGSGYGMGPGMMGGSRSLHAGDSYNNTVSIKDATAQVTLPPSGAQVGQGTDTITFSSSSIDLISYAMMGATQLMQQDIVLHQAHIALAMSLL